MAGQSQAAEVGSPSPRGLFRSRLRDARIRSKLGLILIAPLIAVVAFGALRLVDSGQRAVAAELVRSLTAVSSEVANVSHQLHRERIEAARLLSGMTDDASEFTARSTRTDDAVELYQAARADLGDVPATTADRLARIDEHLAELSTVRQQVLNEEPITVSATVLRYGVILTDIIAYQESVGEVADDPALAERLRAVTALSKAKTHAAEAEAIALSGLTEGRLGEEQLTAFLATQTGQQEAFLEFEQSANPHQRAVADQAVTGGNVVFADRAAAAVQRSVNGDEEIDPATTAAAFSGMVNATRWVEEQLQQDLLQVAVDLRDGVFRQVLIESVAVLLALIIAVLVAVLLARSLARSLGQLRQSALAVAERELPETVARLSDPQTLGEHTPDQLAAQVREPIQLHGRDEIGQVAQAFNVVHRSAVRVAAEQATLRTSVSAMFLNLARRSQSLVDRMITQLDEIERNEEDSKRLAKLFVLDHLATRMRRNDENLLVLAGADSSAPRGDDALVADVLRAAQSEVEQYARIEFGTVDTDVSVTAHAVNDTVRLVAELFDNATRFSSPDTAVVCEARRLGDQVIIQIEDRGVGLSQDQVNRINAWLSSPPTLEVTTFRKMGLAVVARLSQRHHIRVEIRCDPNYGTVAYVALPPQILVLPRSRTVRGVEHSMPRSPLPVGNTPAAPPPPARHAGQLPQRSPGSSYRETGDTGGGTPVTPTGGQPDGTGPAAPTGGGNGHQGDAPERYDMPVAGRPLYGMTSPATPPADSHGSQPESPEATVELPIFREMEQVWFRSHGDLDLGRRQSDGSAAGATAGGGAAGTTTGADPGGAGREPQYRQPSGGHRAEPDPGRGGDTGAGTAAAGEPDANQAWRTAADFGWRAASAAASPTSGGATSSGLPKRVPQAQLVPGSVDSSGSGGGAQRRSPDEIRGLLSAYHRGVQRGRESGGH